MRQYLEKCINEKMFQISNREIEIQKLKVSFNEYEFSLNILKIELAGLQEFSKNKDI